MLMKVVLKKILVQKEYEIQYIKKWWDLAKKGIVQTDFGLMKKQSLRTILGQREYIRR